MVFGSVSAVAGGPKDHNTKGKQSKKVLRKVYRSDGTKVEIKRSKILRSKRSKY